MTFCQNYSANQFITQHILSRFVKASNCFGLFDVFFYFNCYPF